MHFGKSHYSFFCSCRRGKNVHSFVSKAKKNLRVNDDFAIPLSQMSGTTQTDRPEPYTQRTGPRAQEYMRVPRRYLSSFDVTNATIVTSYTEKHMPLSLLLAQLYLAITRDV